MAQSFLRSYGGVALILLLVVSLFAISEITAASAKSDTIEVKWLLSHQPVDVFAGSIEVFAEELSKRSNGRLVLKVITPEDAGYGTVGDIPNAEVISQLESGKVQLASAYTVALGFEDPTVWALTLPYLFDSYAEADEVLDGRVGQEILSGFDNEASTLRALAFTMSGGYRIIASKNTQIENLEDIRGLRIVTSGGPVAEATLRSFGATPVRVDLESGSASFDPATIDAVETTLSRLGQVVKEDSPYMKYLNETNHSMFLTAILSSKSFYDSLSADDQRALRESALLAARAEREDSVELGNEVRTQLQESGSIVTTLTSDARTNFVAATASVYEGLSQLIGQEVISKLRAQ